MVLDTTAGGYSLGVKVRLARKERQNPGRTAEDSLT